MQTCKHCNRVGCPGDTNTLREYADWADLAAHCDEQVIVEWVNKLAVERENRKFYMRRAALRKGAMLAAAKRLLDPDELAEIERGATRIAEKEINDAA